MLSTTMSIPARQRRMPKILYERRKKTLRSGAKLANRCDPQILAARWAKKAIKIPSATVTVPTKIFAAVGAKTI